MAKKILLADDSITIQKVVELTFSDGDFEVVAVNNGARAIQQLQESRPDIILSDIIMPEKNGYEVCEFVKSHPDYRTIPVVLLTGTFEPFDPDRAERAGCDAVVTKPFESQSLIHKVEELIAAATPHPATPSAPESSPFDETAVERRPSLEVPMAPPQRTDVPAASAAAQWETPEAAEPSEPAFDDSPPPSPDEIFGLSSSHDESPAPDPFDETGPPFATAPEASSAPSWPSSEASDDGGLDLGPQDSPEPAPSADAFNLEPPSLPPSGFGELSESEEPASEASTFEPPTSEPTASEGVWSAATTAFPKMSFDELRKMAEEKQPPSEPSAEPSDSAWSAETTAIPKMTFDDLPRPAGPEPTPEPADEASSLPWETSSMPEPQDDGPAWPSPTDSGEPSRQSDPSGFGFETPPPAEESIPYEPTGWPSSEELPAAAADDSLFAPAASPAEEAAVEEPASMGASLSEADVDRIARRVVELLSDRAVREIAWEVIPDIANSVVRDRIRELEAAD